jgi:hypothetical protein
MLIICLNLNTQMISCHFCIKLNSVYRRIFQTKLFSKIYHIVFILAPLYVELYCCRKGYLVPAKLQEDLWFLKPGLRLPIFNEDNAYCSTCYFICDGENVFKGLCYRKTTLSCEKNNAISVLVLPLSGAAHWLTWV